MGSNNEQPPYDQQDEETISNNIFQRLCELDKQDREASREPGWYDLKDIAANLKGFHIREDVRQLAEDILENEKGFIKRDPHSFKVILTTLGRQNCGKRITVNPRD